MESNHLPKGTGLRPAAPPWSERGERSEGERDTSRSPRPESNRILPCTRRVLDRSSCAGRVLAVRAVPRSEARAPARADVRVDSSECPPSGITKRGEAVAMCSCTKRVPYHLASGQSLAAECVGFDPRFFACVATPSGRKGSSGRNRTFEGPVNSRLPDHSASLEHALVASVRAAADSTSPISFEAGRRSGQRARTRRALAPSCQRARDLPDERAVVPGTGFEPVFLASETSVLPLDDPGAVTASARRLCCVVRRSGRSGGNRTLTIPIKSRVRFQLRYGPVTGDEREPRAGQTCPRPRESR